MMRVLLTAEQAHKLKPYFDRVRAAAEQGSPGMLVGQISYDDSGLYWIVPAFLPNDLAEMITRRGTQL